MNEIKRYFAVAYKIVDSGKNYHKWIEDDSNIIERKTLRNGMVQWKRSYDNYEPDYQAEIYLAVELNLTREEIDCLKKLAILRIGFVPRYLEDTTTKFEGDLLSDNIPIRLIDATSINRFQHIAYITATQTFEQKIPLCNELWQAKKYDNAVFVEKRGCSEIVLRCFASGITEEDVFLCWHLKNIKDICDAVIKSRLGILVNNEPAANPSSAKYEFIPFKKAYADELEKRTGHTMNSIQSYCKKAKKIKGTKTLYEGKNGIIFRRGKHSNSSKEIRVEKKS